MSEQIYFQKEVQRKAVTTIPRVCSRNGVSRHRDQGATRAEVQKGLYHKELTCIFRAIFLQNVSPLEKQHHFRHADLPLPPLELLDYNLSAKIKPFKFTHVKIQ